MPAAELAATASALKSRYAALLAPEASFHRPDVDRVEDAIDAARARLRGGEAPRPDQLSFDVR